MSTKSLKTVPKISIRVWTPLIKKLDAKMENACLRRDAYLSKVLETELKALDAEVSIPNSQASYDYVLERLNQLDRKLVSLALPLKLIERLNDVCSRKRIVRDAFFNRLFLLLAVSPTAIDELLFPNVTSKWRNEVWSENRNEGPFFQNSFCPLQPTIDPFWAIRSGLELFVKDEKLEDYVDPTNGKRVKTTRDITGAIVPANTLYTAIFEQKGGNNNLLGLNCYMPDSRIPGHMAEKKLNAKLDEMLAEMGVQS